MPISPLETDPTLKLITPDQKNEDIYKAPEKDAVSRDRVEFNAIA